MSEDAYGYKGRIGTSGESLIVPAAAGGQIAGAIGSELGNHSGTPQAPRLLDVVRGAYS